MQKILNHPYLCGFSSNNINTRIDQINTNIISSYIVEIEGLYIENANDIMWKLVSYSNANDFQIMLKHRLPNETTINIERVGGVNHYNISGANSGGIQAVTLIHDILNLKI